MASEVGGWRSFSRVAAWSFLGSIIVILIGLAARPEPLPDIESTIESALAAYGGGDREGARALADALVRSDPAHPRVWLLVGMLDEDRRDIDGAERAYRRALDLMPEGDTVRADVELSLADLQRRKGNPEGALVAIDALARKHGESGRIRHARVLSMIDLRRFDDALSETRLMAEEEFGAGVARRLEKQIQSSMKAESRRGD